MKRVIFVLALIATTLLSASSFAQKGVDKDIEEIRKQYSEALESLQYRTDEEYPARNLVTVNSDEMWPGSGGHKTSTTIFFDVDLDEGAGIVRTPFFARVKYNIAARNYYYEVLFDRDGGKPLFYYTKIETYDKGPVECRYYYKNGKAIKTICPVQHEEIPSAQQAYQEGENLTKLLSLF